MKLLIAEKFKVANESYKPLLQEMEGESFQSKDGYFQGKNWCISWCVGHLVGLCVPDEYEGWDAWTEDVLPMLPAAWKHQVLDSTKKQFRILSGLINNSELVVNGADAGREGELIYGRVMEQATTKRIPQKRLWVNSYVMKDMVKRWGDLKDISEYKYLYESAVARSQSDWLVGVNFSRGYILKSGVRQLSVGRVQTPTLALIVKRDQEIANWVEAYFFELMGRWKGVRFNYYDEEGKEFENESVLTSILAYCRDKEAELIKKETNDRHSNPPKPFDLLRLQKEANKVLGFKAQKTLDLAQALYEKKKISYPRTDSEYLPESMKDECFYILEKLADEQTKSVLKAPSSSFAFFNNAKVTDHYALIPTGEDIQDLSGDELALYQLITQRFMTAFCKPYRFRQTDLELACGQYRFKATLKQELEKGYQRLTGENQEITGDDQVIEADIQAEVGDRERFATLAIDKKKRTKPKHYTESTLLTAMETAGRNIEDDMLREAMKGRGLGTAATQSGIIELLKKREYIREQGKYLVANEKGQKLISIVSEELASAEMTGEWEFKLKQMEKGKYPYDQFMHEIRKFVSTRIAAIKTMQLDVQGLSTAQNENGHSCPACNSGVKMNKHGVFCTSCEFKIWRKVAGKLLTDTMLESLLTKGITGKVKGLKGSKGSFECKLELAENGSVKFKFD